MTDLNRFYEKLRRKQAFSMNPEQLPLGDLSFRASLPALTLDEMLDCFTDPVLPEPSYFVRAGPPPKVPGVMLMPPGKAPREILMQIFWYSYESIDIGDSKEPLAFSNLLNWMGVCSQWCYFIMQAESVKLRLAMATKSIEQLIHLPALRDTSVPFTENYWRKWNDNDAYNVIRPGFCDTGVTLHNAFELSLFVNRSAIINDLTSQPYSPFPGVFDKSPFWHYDIDHFRIYGYFPHSGDSALGKESEGCLIDNQRSCCDTCYIGTPSHGAISLDNFNRIPFAHQYGQQEFVVRALQRGDYRISPSTVSHYSLRRWNHSTCSLFAPIPRHDSRFFSKFVTNSSVESAAANTYVRFAPIYNGTIAPQRVLIWSTDKNKCSPGQARSMETEPAPQDHFVPHNFLDDQDRLAQADNVLLSYVMPLEGDILPGRPVPVCENTYTNAEIRGRYLSDILLRLYDCHSDIFKTLEDACVGDRLEFEMGKSINYQRMCKAIGISVTNKVISNLPKETDPLSVPLTLVDHKLAEGAGQESIHVQQHMAAGTNRVLKSCEKHYQRTVHELNTITCGAARCLKSDPLSGFTTQKYPLNWAYHLHHLFRVYDARVQGYLYFRKAERTLMEPKVAEMLRKLNGEMFTGSGYNGVPKKSPLFHGQDLPGLKCIDHKIGDPTKFHPRTVMNDGYQFGELESRPIADPYIIANKWCDTMAYSSTPDFIRDFIGERFSGMPGSYRIAFKTDHLTQLPFFHPGTCPIPNCFARASGHQTPLELAAKSVNGALELLHRTMKNNEKKEVIAESAAQKHGIALSKPAPLEHRLTGYRIESMVKNSLHECSGPGFSGDHDPCQQLTPARRVHTTKTGPRHALPGDCVSDCMMARDAIALEISGNLQNLMKSLRPLDQVDHSFYKHKGNKKQVEFVASMLGWTPPKTHLDDNTNVEETTFWHCPATDCQLQQDPWTLEAALKKHLADYPEDRAPHLQQVPGDEDEDMYEDDEDQEPIPSDQVPESLRNWPSDDEDDEDSSQEY